MISMKGGLSILFFLLFVVNITFAQDSKLIDGEIIVQLREGSHIDHLRSNIDDRNSQLKVLSANLRIYLLSYDVAEISNDRMKHLLSQDRTVDYFTQNRTAELRNTPNDKHYNKQWNMMRIGTPTAWDETTGGRTALDDEIVVAVMDSGFDLGISDLSVNVYLNRDEELGDANNDGCPGVCGEDDDGDGLIDEDGANRLPSNPLYNSDFSGDDDENGYIDDIRGLNMDNNTDVHPALNHGTAVAGIIGAKGNNSVGVTGVNWDVKMMLFSNVKNVAQIVEAYQYIYDKRKLYNDTDGKKGAYIVVTNFSSGIDKMWGDDFPTWCGMYDLLGEVGILSVGATTNKSTNVDEEGDLPTTCTSPYLIAVTNLTMEDRLPTAGYGKTHIDIGAPGNGTVSLGVGEIDDVGGFSGTSAATPHVAGAIALIHSIPCENFASYYKSNPDKVLEIKEVLLNTVDPISDLSGKAVSEGRLNIYSVMQDLKSFCSSDGGGDLAINNIFPNPSHREPITIEYDGPDGVGAYDLSIYSALGGLVYNEKFTPSLYGERRKVITPPDLAGGIYVIVMTANKEIVAKKHFFVPYKG